MCPCHVKTHDFIALRVFNNIHAESFPQNVYYRVITVREGGHTPETRAASLTDGAAVGTSRGETAASVLHGVDVAVGLARMLLPGVPLGRPNTTGWRGPLVKARPCKVKGVDPVVKRYRVRRAGALGG